MSKCKVSNRVRFKDAAGHERIGVVLSLRSDRCLVGYQPTEEPTARITDARGRVRTVPNNSLWVVPYADIIEAMV